MAITNKKVIQRITKIQESELEFVSFGSFLLDLFMLPIEDQEMLTSKLLLIKNFRSEDKIKSFRRINNGDKRSPYKYFYTKFIILYSFRCIGCNKITEREINSYGGHIPRYCEVCYD